MDEFLLVPIFIFLVLIYIAINSKFKSLENYILNLTSSIDKIRAELKALKELQSEGKVIHSEIKPKEETVIIPVQKPDEKVTEIKETVFENVSYSDKTVPPVKEPEVIVSKPISASSKPTITTPKKSWSQNFKEKNPDLEKFIGENLINKIGILILVLGVSYFVKFAIDKDWIPEIGRVGIGILTGSAILAVAHKLRINYSAFSSVLVAGAISIFYFTIGIAFHSYHIFNQTTAFIIMVFITIFSVVISIGYNRQELAVLSLIGGFAVPFMVSTGQGNYIVLFSYIAILNIGMLIISYFKKWNLLQILSFIFTTILFGVWISFEMDSKTFSPKGAFVFATLFYFLFSIAVVINNIKNKGVFSKIEYFILLANTFAYFGFGVAILRHFNIPYTGVFTLTLALYNLIFGFVLFKKFGIDKNAVYVLIGLVLTFVTLTIPIQFEGNQITLFWACEAVILFWLAKKSGITFFKYTAVVIQVLGIFSLFMDWEKYNLLYQNFHPTFVSSIFITGLVVLITLYATIMILRNEANDNKTEDSITPDRLKRKITAYRNFLNIFIIILGYLIGFIEVNHLADLHLKSYTTNASVIAVYHFVFSLVLIYSLHKNNEGKNRKIAFLLSVFNVLYYFTIQKLSVNEKINNLFDATNYSHSHYLHILLFFFVLLCFYYIYLSIKNQTFIVLKKPLFSWIFVAGLVFILSNELSVQGYYFRDFSTVLNKIKTANIKTEESYYKYDFINNDLDESNVLVSKIGFPILWGLISFALLIFGIKKQLKLFRVIALTLLGLTIVKLFVYDISNASETGKIIAFILLGVLILIISFVYQKIKRMVIDEPENIKENTNESNENL
jgi:hypothetical protein